MTEQKSWRVVDCSDDVIPLRLSSDVEAYLVAELPSQRNVAHVLEVLAYFPKLPSHLTPVTDADRERAKDVRKLIAAAPRMLRFIRYCYGDLGLGGGITGEDMDELRSILRELEGGAL